MFWERFLSECERIGKKPNPVGKEVGVSSGTVTGWKNGVVPKPEKLQKIADYFGCTTDYLLGLSDCRTLDDASNMFSDLTEQERTLIRMFRETTEEGRFEMIASIVNIKSAIEKKHSGENPGNVGAI